MSFSVRNQFRNLLGIRRERRIPRRTGRPPLGARIVLDDFRMVVQSGLDKDLWTWLQEQGWREVTFRPDRRVYRDIPSSWMTLLIDAPPEHREAVLKAAMADARKLAGATRRSV